MLRDAVTVCFRQMHDPQLALVLCRLIEGTESAMAKLITVQNFLPFTQEHHDAYMQYLAYYGIQQPKLAVEALLTTETGYIYRPCTAHFLRLIHFNRNRLFAISEEHLQSAERRSAFEYLRQGNNSTCVLCA